MRSGERQVLEYLSVIGGLFSGEAGYLLKIRLGDRSQAKM